MQKHDGYAKMQVYEKSYKASLAVYGMTKQFPKEERNGITDQMRRASMSIPLNIAEGYAKKESQAEFKRFLMMAMGSANEMSVLINFAKDLGYLEQGRYQKALEEYESIGKMLNTLIKRVKEQIK